ncbi:MAG: hypothetical protein LUF27_17375 [Lachnospiraceae bacterium]|nr:hypothetical protein [Lachnospiraceae bacterium]
MSRVVYGKKTGRASLCKDFEIRLNEEGQMISLKNRTDVYQMEWLNGKEIWGTILAPDELAVRVDRSFTGEGCLRETYRFQNTSPFDVFVKRDEIGIYTTFPDDYQSAETCMKQRCHVHAWCGCNTAYLYGLRMGGEAPHLGLVLTEGSIDGYSIVRDESKSSNDRGCLILHPEAFHLASMETLTLSWELFWFENREDFFRRMRRYENVLLVCAERYITFPGESQRLKLIYGGGLGTAPDALPVHVIRNGTSEMVFSKTDEEGLSFGVEGMPEEYGEQCWEIQYGPYHTTAKTLALPEFQVLLKKRCAFIAGKQQYQASDSPLYGAFLIYDNEENRQYYSHLSDHNGGRERVGMGILLARYLQKFSDPAVENSLRLFRSYLYRELFDRETGTVYNDICRNNDQPRLYNYPWAAEFFIEIFRLYRNPEDLESMYRALMAFYRNGGQKMYAIEIPVADSLELLYENREYKKREELLACYRRHADFMLETGLNYPAHEVNYEQSIVAPGVDFLLQVYQATKEDKYLEMAKKTAADSGTF